MRPPSSVEHPAAAKMSATNASSAFALRVTVPMRALRPAHALQVGDVAAVPGWGDLDLVDHDMRRQAGDVADQIADILRLRHAGTLFLADGDRPPVEDGRCHLARADHRGADTVDALLHVDGVAHRHH